MADTDLSMRIAIDSAALQRVNQEIKTVTDTTRALQAELDSVNSSIRRGGLASSLTNIAGIPKQTALDLLLQSERDWIKSASSTALFDAAQRTRAAALSTTNQQVRAEMTLRAIAMDEERYNRLIADAKQRQLDLSRSRASLPPTGGVGGGGTIPPVTGPGGTNWVDPYKDAVAQINAMTTAGKKLNFTAREIAIGFRSVGSAFFSSDPRAQLYYMSQIGRTMTGTALAAGLVALGVAVVVTSLWQLIKAGAQIEGVSKAFENMTRNAGLSGDKLAADIQTAAKGALSMADTMRAANRALMAGGAELAASLPRLMEVARAAAVASGQDVSYTFDSLVKGIVRGSPRLIDNADIYLKLGDATGIYAKEIGKSVTELTAQERIQATLNAVLKQGDSFIAAMGVSSKTSGEKIQSFTASITDLKNALGERLVATGVTNIFDNSAKDIRASIAVSAALQTYQRNLKNLYNLQGIGLQEVQTDNGIWLRMTAQNIQAQEFYNQVLRKTAEARAKLAQDPTFIATQGLVSSTEAREAYAKALADIATQIQEFVYGTKEQQAAMDAGDVGWAQQRTNVEKTKAALEGVITPLEAYNKALAEGADRLGPVAQAKAFAELALSLKAVNEAMVMPELGKTALTTDTSKLKEFAALYKSALPRPEDVGKSDALTTLIVQTDESQRKAIELANSFGTAEARIKSFAQSAFGAGAGVQDILKNWDQLPPLVQQAALDMGLLEIAIKDMRAQAAKPVTPVVQYSSVEDAYKQIDDLTLKLRAAGATDEATAFRTKGYAIVNAFAEGLTRGAGNVPKNVFDQMVQDLMQPLQAEQEQLQSRLQAFKDFQAQLDNIARLPGPRLPKTTAKLPDIGTALMTYDTAAVDRYLNSLSGLGAGEAALVANLRTTNATIKEQQTAAIAAAQALGPGEAALRQMALAAGIADGDIDTLIETFKDLPAGLQPAIASLGIFTVALQRMQAQANAPISVDAQIESAQKSLDALGSSTMNLTKYWNVEDITAFYKKASNAMLAELTALDQEKMRRGINMTRQEYETRAKIIEEKYTGIVDTEVSYFEGAKSRSKQAVADSKKDAGAVRSAIEAALSKGLAVSAADMLATKAGTYQDKAMENARRLNAIAERGFAELKRHGDWAAILQIPPEVLAGSEAGLKAWAAQTSEDVQNLIRPDLINWDAFAANYKKGIQDEIAKNETLKRAYQELQARGFLGGKSEAEARKEVLKALGIADNEITFESYFGEATTDDNATRAALDFLRNGKAITLNAEMNVKTNPIPPAEPVGPNGGIPGKYSGSSVTPPIAQTEIASMGADIAGNLYTSMELAVKAQDVGGMVANYYSASFAASGDLWSAMGTSAGAATGTAYVTALKKNVGNVKAELARLLAPEVAEILDRRGKGQALQ